MEQFSSIQTFDDFPTERFKEQLESLSIAKESIDKAAQFVVENVTVIDDLFEVLLNRMRKSAYSKRLPYFYLIDSICQNCHSKKNDAYRTLISVNIEEILPLTLPDESMELKKKNREIIEKTLGIWEKNNIFDETLLSKANSILSGAIKESNRLICPNLTEKELAKLLKKMDDDRREHKKRKYQILMDSQHPLEEFIEFWCRICLAIGTPEQNTDIQDTDYETYDNYKKKFNLSDWSFDDIDLIHYFNNTNNLNTNNNNYNNFNHNNNNNSSPHFNNNNIDQNNSIYLNNNHSNNSNYNGYQNHPFMMDNQYQQQQDRPYSPNSTSEYELLKVYLQKLKRNKH